jgi:hypothetical protein
MICTRLRRSRVKIHAQDRRIGHTRRRCLTGNGNCLLLQYTKEQAGNARLMLDVLIETVSHDPLTIFIVVAIVLLIMLARTL